VLQQAAATTTVYAIHLDFAYILIKSFKLPVGFHLFLNLFFLSWLQISGMKGVWKKLEKLSLFPPF
jgi:hypothetical protein